MGERQRSIRIDPITSTFTRIYDSPRLRKVFQERSAKFAAVLIIMFAWISLSLVGNVFYRTHYWPNTSLKIAHIRQKAELYLDTKKSAPTGFLSQDTIDKIVEDPNKQKELEEFVPPSTQKLIPHYRLLRYLELRAFTPEQRKRNLKTWLQNELKDASYYGDDIYGDIRIFFYFDLGLYLDKGLFRPVILTALSLLLIMTWKTFHTNQLFVNAYTHQSRLKIYLKNVPFGIWFSKETALLVIMIGFIIRVADILSKAKDFSANIVLIFAYVFTGIVVLYFFATFAVTFFTRFRFSLFSVDTLPSRLLTLVPIPIVLATCGLIIAFLTSSLTWDMFIGYKHVEGGIIPYNQFDRLLTDTYMIYGLLVSVQLSLFLLFSFVRFGLKPNFEAQDNLYGFRPLAWIISLVIVSWVATTLMILQQIAQSGGGNDPGSFNFHVVSLSLAVIGDAAMIILVITFYRKCRISLQMQRQEVKDRLDKLSKDEGSATKKAKLSTELNKFFENLKSLNCPEIIRQAMVSLPGLGVITSLVLSHYAIILRLLSFVYYE